ncbi:hypothetical protein [Pseudalkalibacillus sp. SCS-8]|uniref:hypothetical protein n=1 Tax=Pseudalkalibacillus nanhaiensis TaxID=3115291 RepID=UPI0032DB3E5D
MKKFSIVLLFFLLLYSVYFDLKFGTLPSTKAEALPVQAAYSEEETQQAYKEIIVQPGETMLTILERLHNGNLPVSIEVAVADFERLNEGISAHNIKAAHTYRFPHYP